MMCYIRRGGEGFDGAAVSAAADGEVEKCEFESISATCVCARPCIATVVAGSSSLARCCRRRGDN